MAGDIGKTPAAWALNQDVVAEKGNDSLWENELRAWICLKDCVEEEQNFLKIHRK